MRRRNRVALRELVVASGCPNSGERLYLFRAPVAVRYHFLMDVEFRRLSRHPTCRARPDPGPDLVHVESLHDSREIFLVSAASWSPPAAPSPRRQLEGWTSRHQRGHLGTSASGDRHSDTTRQPALLVHTVGAGCKRQRGRGEPPSGRPEIDASAGPASTPQSRSAAGPLSTSHVCVPPVPAIRARPPPAPDLPAPARSPSADLPLPRLGQPLLTPWRQRPLWCIALRLAPIIGFLPAWALLPRDARLDLLGVRHRCRGRRPPTYRSRAIGGGTRFACRFFPPAPRGACSQWPLEQRPLPRRRQPAAPPLRTPGRLLVRRAVRPLSHLPPSCGRLRRRCRALLGPPFARCARLRP